MADQLFDAAATANNSDINTDDCSSSTFNSVCFRGPFHDLSVVHFNSKTRNFERCFKLNTIDLTNDDNNDLTFPPPPTVTSANNNAARNVTQTQLSQSHSPLSQRIIDGEEHSNVLYE